MSGARFGRAGFATSPVLFRLRIRYRQPSLLGEGRALSGRRRRHIRVITEGCGVRRVRLMFLATCLAWLERRKRDHHMVALATRDDSAARLASVAERDGGENETTV